MRACARTAGGGGLRGANEIAPDRPAALPRSGQRAGACTAQNIRRVFNSIAGAFTAGPERSERRTARSAGRSASTGDGRHSVRRNRAA